MRQALGITEEIWDQMRVPQYIGHDLDETTQLYVDIHIAIELFHMRYPDYIAQTTPAERQLYQLYIALKNKKDEHVRWHQEHDQRAAEVARNAVGTPHTRG